MSPTTSARNRFLAVAAVAVAVPLLVLAAAGHRPDPAAQAQIERIAGAYAAAAGDPRPDFAALTLTTHHRALAFTDAGSDGGADFPVVLVELHGVFTAYTAHLPPGAKVPHGTLLTVVVDRTTLRVTDWGVADGTAADIRRLSSLGPVSTFELPGR
jgi:hypothetical protein